VIPFVALPLLTKIDLHHRPKEPKRSDPLTEILFDLASILRLSCPLRDEQSS
jgi:hypothetical protein